MALKFCFFDLIPTTLGKNRYYKPQKQNFKAIDA